MYPKKRSQRDNVEHFALGGFIAGFHSSSVKHHIFGLKILGF